MSSAEIHTHSALHVLKGAVQKVLGAKWTASVHVRDGHGRLTVQFDRKPTQDELVLVEQEANRKISEGSEIIEFEMEKEEAERHFGDEMYDLFPLPTDVKRLRLVRIPDWNLNCCIEKHLENTSAIGGIRIDRVRFRGSRKQLEVDFHVTGSGQPSNNT